MHIPPGFGMWQTVAVRTVDEEQERRQLEDQEKELEEDRVSGVCIVSYYVYQNKIKMNIFKLQRAVKASIVDENTESGDVLKAYDPYNRGVYKGIKVSRECTETEVLHYNLCLFALKFSPISCIFNID